MQPSGRDSIRELDIEPWICAASNCVIFITSSTHVGGGMRIPIEREAMIDSSIFKREKVQLV